MFQKVNHRVMLATITLLAFAEAVPVVKPSPSQSPQKLKGKFQPTKQTWKGMQGSKSADLQDEPKEPTDFLETVAAGNELHGRETRLDQREGELHERERLLAEREEMLMQEKLSVKDELIAMLQERLKDKEHAVALEMRKIALLEQHAHAAIAPRKAQDLHQLHHGEVNDVASVESQQLDSDDDPPSCGESLLDNGERATLGPCCVGLIGNCRWTCCGLNEKCVTRDGVSKSCASR